MTIRPINFDINDAITNANRFYPATDTPHRDYLVKSVNQFCERTFFAKNVVSGDQFWLIPRNEYTIPKDNSTATSSLLQINSNFTNFSYRSSIAYSSLLSLVNNTLSTLNVSQVNISNPALNSVTGNVSSLSFAKSYDLPEISYSNTVALENEISNLLRIVSDQIVIYAAASTTLYETKSNSGVTKAGIYYDFAGDPNIADDLKQMYQKFINCLADNA